MGIGQLQENLQLLAGIGGAGWGLSVGDSDSPVFQKLHGLG